MTKPAFFEISEITIAALEHTILETIRGVEPHLAPPGAEATISVGPMRVNGTVVLTLTVAIHGGTPEPRRLTAKKGGKKP